MKTLLVVEQVKDWKLNVEGLSLVSSKDYLTDPQYQTMRKVRVFNLCRSYGYQQAGYYVSLLAAARKHVVIPSVANILDVKSQSILRINAEEIEDIAQKTLRDVVGDEYLLSVYFGKNLNEKYDRLSREIYKLYNVPLIRAKFVKKEKWRLTSVTPMELKDVPQDHHPDIERFAKDYFLKRLTSQKSSISKFNLAILIDKDEKMPPSNERALKKFIAAADELNIDTEFITKDDIGRLAEFDGLFIRTTTAVNHFTFRFAQKAHALDLVVIDDPESILRCTNKVYLAELFSHHNIPSPKTTLVHHDTLKSLDSVTLPAVLKIPDSAFSKGVIKVETREELKNELSKMLKTSDLVVAQEFMPTDFDWRIGMIGGKALFACKYFMARNHWQIYKQDKSGNPLAGDWASVPLSEVPPKLLQLACKAGSLIGSGLYGLDIKEHKDKYAIIEINDNPNIDAGVEDEQLKDELYLEVMKYFLNRMEKRTTGGGK